MKTIIFILLVLPFMAIAKDVEVYDIDTGKVSLVPQESLGAEYVRIDLEGKIFWADSNKLKQNEYQHPPFEGERKERCELQWAIVSQRVLRQQRGQGARQDRGAPLLNTVI